MKRTTIWASCTATRDCYDDAIRHFQRAIAINPGYARARNNLGVVYLGQRKFDTAASQFHAALAIDPKNVESMVNLSTVEQGIRTPRSGQGAGSRARSKPIRAMPRLTTISDWLEDEAGNRTQALAHYRAFLQYGAAVASDLGRRGAKR